MEEKDWLWVKFKRPKLILAPMVDQSELAFRLLCRKYGAELCYSPMLNANVFVKYEKYRKDHLANVVEDRPLIIQFCCNDPNIFLEAVEYAMPYCDAVDLNLGCPQTIAKRGNYGAFLQDQWDLLYKMVNVVYMKFNFPITCKIRIFQDIQKTIRYAQMLESAGCQLLTVHGRTKEQKGVLTGLASWEHIRAVKQNVKIPVFANGNVQSLTDLYNCLKETGANGVMSAEGLLYNPALFKGVHMPTWEVAKEYMELVDKYPCKLSIIRGHLFKIFNQCLNLPENFDLRDNLAKACKRHELQAIIDEFKNRYSKDEPQYCEMSSFPVPPYLCQPHFRPLTFTLQTGMKNSEENISKEKNVETNKIKRNARKAEQKSSTSSKKKRLLCSTCPNPKGIKCTFDMCRTCCRGNVIKMLSYCEGHKFMTKKHQVSLKEKKTSEVIN